MKKNKSIIKKSGIFNSVILITVLLLPGVQAKAQSVNVDYPIVGQPLPDFKLLNVDYYKKKTFEPADVKGKWLILDFWSLGCSSCIQAFPKVNQLSQEFKESIQFLLVGQNNKYNKNIKKAFDRYTTNLRLTLPIAYDSALFEKFKISATPYVLVIDPEGIVYAITYSTLSAEKLQDLIDNKKPSFEKRIGNFGERSPVRWEYAPREENVRKETFLYRSILSPFNEEEFEFSETIDPGYASHGIFKVTGAPLSSLYKFAWFGQSGWGQRDTFYSTHWKSPVLEVADPKFSLGDKFNIFLSVPKERANREGLMKTLRGNLENYFGYTAAIETRLMPCWELIATEDARKKLKSNYNKFEGEFTATGIHAKHLPVEVLVGEIRHYTTEAIPIFDETGIKYPIDLNFTAAMIDMNDVRSALRKQGLILEKSSRPMKVLIIHDAKL